MEANATAAERSNQSKSRKRAAFKSPSRKASPAAKRAAAKATASKSASNRYGKSAVKLMKNGKSALDSAYSWAGSAGRSLPRAARNVHLPDHGTVQEYITDRPLILGAVGLGLGMALGAMLPHAVGVGRTAERTARRK